jgi:hypothetical protein
MCDIRNASLILKTTDLTINKNAVINGNVSTSSYGSNNKQLSLFTWNNINLRTILGDMYDQYDEFNLSLNTISTSICTTFDFNPLTDYKNIYIKMSGLPFINNTYNLKNGCNTNAITITSLNFTNGEPLTNYFYSTNIATFGKSQELANITLEYYSILFDAPIPQSINITGATCTGSNGNYYFTIGGGANGNVYAGMSISGTNIQPNTIITGNNGTTFYINQPLTGDNIGTAIVFTVSYPNIALHAICRDKDSFPEPCIFCQLDEPVKKDGGKAFRIIEGALNNNDND